MHSLVTPLPQCLRDDYQENESSELLFPPAIMGGTSTINEKTIAKCYSFNTSHNLDISSSSHVANLIIGVKNMN